MIHFECMWDVLFRWLFGFAHVYLPFVLFGARKHTYSTNPQRWLHKLKRWSLYFAVVSVILHTDIVEVFILFHRIYTLNTLCRSLAQYLNNKSKTKTFRFPLKPQVIDQCIYYLHKINKKSIFGHVFVLYVVGSKSIKEYFLHPPELYKNAQGKIARS